MMSFADAACLTQPYACDAFILIFASAKNVFLPKNKKNVNLKNILGILTMIMFQKIFFNFGNPSPHSLPLYFHIKNKGHDILSPYSS